MERVDRWRVTVHLAVKPSPMWGFGHAALAAFAMVQGGTGCLDGECRQPAAWWLRSHCQIARECNRPMATQGGGSEIGIICYVQEYVE